MATGSRPPDLGAEDMYQRERIRYQWMLDSIQKFRVFFAGLVFAMLAFAIQFPVQLPTTAVKYLQVIAWACLLITGVLALRDAGGFVARHTEDSFNGLSKPLRIAMWGLFVVALALLGAARVWPA